MLIVSWQCLYYSFESATGNAGNGEEAGSVLSKPRGKVSAMAGKPENEKLFGRVRFFAWATIVAAVLVLPLSLVQTAAKRANSIYANYGGTFMDGVREVCAFVADFFQNGVVFAFLLVGMATITLLVLRLASSESDKRWAPHSAPRSSPRPAQPGAPAAGQIALKVRTSPSGSDRPTTWSQTPSTDVLAAWRSCPAAYLPAS